MTLVGLAPSWALPLSPGDRLRLFIPGEEGLPDNERFSATYEVNLDGTLKIPYLAPFPVAGREVSQVEQQIRQALIGGGFFQPQFLRVSLQIFEWAPVQVTIAGAVYDPGRYLINSEEESKGRDLPAAIATVSGDYPPERYLTSAIRLAGGVKPNANLSAIRLIRGGQEQLVDLSGVFTGAPVEDVALIAGDQVIVPEVELAQNDLVRPSQVTPATIRVFLSNLSTPREGANVQAQEMPYGARFSQAVIAANCVGGRTTTRGRRAVLVQTDRATGETKTVERSVEDLVRNASDDTVNPYLMRDDSVVCYDSTTTNVTSVFNAIGNILNPINIIRNLFNND
ncbi:MAG: polysaccharide export protein [Coleofasciculus sp. S288]|nr:polysaccharide export protein [Coleofasciculus sp. S288]